MVSLPRPSHPHPPLPLYIVSPRQNAAAATGADIQLAAFNEIAANASACVVKASHTVQINGCAATIDCTGLTFKIPDSAPLCAGATQTLSVTVKGAPACRGARRPTLLANGSSPASLFTITNPRVALAFNSLVINCGGFRGAIDASAGKSITVDDFNKCSKAGYAAINAFGGTPVTVKGGAFKLGAGGSYSAIQLRGVPTSTGTLLW